MTEHVVQTPNDVSLHMYQGDDFGFGMTIVEDLRVDPPVPVDLVGATVLAQIRQTPEADEVLQEFTYSIVDNTVFLALLPDQVASLPARCRWDCELTLLDGTKRTVAYGPVVVTRDVSRV